MTLDTPNFFADAEANFNSAKYIIFGIPYDKTSSFRKGASQAPDAIRKASWNFETYDLRTGLELSKLIHDYGNLEVEESTVDQMIHTTKKFTEKILTQHKIPIALGGEHSITPGIIQAFPTDTTVIVCDAHLDFRNTYQKQKYNHACALRRISEHVGMHNLFLLGVRSAEKNELMQAKTSGLFYRDIFKIRKEGIKTALKDIQNQISSKNIYFSLDIDVIDPSIAPGTSTPEPFGLTSIEILQILDVFGPKCIGFDLTEVCPPYDHGQTALLASKLIRLILSYRRRKGVI